MLETHDASRAERNNVNLSFNVANSPNLGTGLFQFWKFVELRGTRFHEDIIVRKNALLLARGLNPSLTEDALGRVIRKSQSVFAGDGEIDSFVPSTHEKNPTITEYDAIGRVKKITLPRAEGESNETSISTACNDPWEVIETHSIGRNKKDHGKNDLRKVRGNYFLYASFLWRT